MTQTHEQKYDELIEKHGGLRVFARLVPADMNTIRQHLRDGDIHLNKIPLHQWDAMAGLTGNGLTTFSMRFNGAWAKANGLSLAERVCMLKRAAVRVANGEVTA